MTERPKLLWHSNAAWTGTGYGQQTALFTPRLNEHYEVVISAFYGLEGNVIPWNKLPVLPGIGGTYGNECIAEHAHTTFGEDVRSGLILTLMDVWVLDPAIWRQFNVASWVPVDHEPAPGPVRAFFENSGAIPIAMSKFGAAQLADLDPLYVPHGCDTKAYKPVPQDEARELTKIPKDAFVVGMVAANKGNPSRKCFMESFQAFKALHDRHPDSMLYVHTEVTGRFQGVDLLALLDAVGVPAKATVFADQYRAVHFPFPHDTMAAIYSSMDVLLSPSAGEGFGLSVLEANACGVPAIVSDFSAQPEVCGAGWTVKGDRFFTPIKSWQFRPDVNDITESLNHAYSLSGAAREQVARKAREHALQYDVDRVLTEHLLPALEAVRERFAEREPVAVAA